MAAYTQSGSVHFISPAMNFELSPVKHITANIQFLRRQINYNGISTRLRLFYAKKFENCDYCKFIFIFCFLRLNKVIWYKIFLI